MPLSDKLPELMAAFFGGGGTLAAVLSYINTRREKATEARRVDVDARTSETDNALKVVNNALNISRDLQQALKKELEDLRKLNLDTETMLDTLADENRKLIRENAALTRRNEQLVDEGATLRKDIEVLTAEVNTLRGRVQGLETAHVGTPTN